MKPTNYQTERARRIRRDVIQALGGKCKRCGFDDFRALQIDHVNGGGLKEFKAKGSGTGHYVRVAKVIKENPNQTTYQVLCANCNWIKRAENNESRGANQHDHAAVAIKKAEKRAREWHPWDVFDPSPRLNCERPRKKTS